MLASAPTMETRQAYSKVLLTAIAQEGANSSVNLYDKMDWHCHTFHTFPS